MKNRKNWITVIIVTLGLAMFVPVAQAQRQEFSGVACGATTYNVVHFTPEMGIMSYDGKWIFRSDHESKLFDNWTAHVVGLIKKEGAKWTWNTLAKYMGPEGEFIIWEIQGDSESGSTAKPIYGTGKWKGIKGERKAKRITTGKPILQGTDQLCEKHVGWIELPK